MLKYIDDPWLKKICFSAQPCQKFQFQTKIFSVSKKSYKLKPLPYIGKISIYPHASLSIQFMDKKNNYSKNIKWLCFRIVLGGTEIFPGLSPQVEPVIASKNDMGA